MPFKIIAPRKGRSQNYRIRGTELGVRLDESTGTHRRAAAEAYLARRRKEIESSLTGERPDKTFAAAVNIYLDTCGDSEVPRVNRVLERFGSWPLTQITNEAIRDYAREVYPPGPSERPSSLNATINRELVSPVSAICHAGGLERRFRRYREPSGRVRVDPPEAISAFLVALPERVARVYPKLKREDPPRYPRALALFIFCCNARRGDAFTLDWPNVDLGRSQAHLPCPKNGEPRTIHLPAVVVAVMASLPHREGKVFGYRHEDTINKDWLKALEKVLPAYPILKGLTPHGGRHDFASWARQQGADLKKIMDMGGWKSYKSVLRYEHVPSEEVKEALEASPLNRGKSVESGQDREKDAI